MVDLRSLGNLVQQLALQLIRVGKIEALIDAQNQYGIVRPDAMMRDAAKQFAIIQTS